MKNLDLTRCRTTKERREAMAEYCLIFIRNHQKASAADIASAAGVSTKVIGPRLSDLMAEGKIRCAGKIRTKTAGQPPKVWRLQ